MEQPRMNNSVPTNEFEALNINQHRNHIDNGPDAMYVNPRAQALLPGISDASSWRRKCLASENENHYAETLSFANTDESCSLESKYEQNAPESVFE